MPTEWDEIAGAIIFWKGALCAQFTPDTQAFAREQIARLEKRADELAREEPSFWWEGEEC